jgi:hypothetical protein
MSNAPEDDDDFLYGDEEAPEPKKLKQDDETTVDKAPATDMVTEESSLRSATADQQESKEDQGEDEDEDDYDEDEDSVRIGKDLLFEVFMYIWEV